MNTPFIALEGLHGVGKSTAAHRLASQLGVEVTATIPPEYGTVRHMFTGPEHLNARLQLFVSALHMAALDIQAQLESGIPVVVESYFYRTLAFHYGMGATSRYTLPDELVMPDLTIHLTCDEAVRQERLAGRDRGPKKYWDSLAEERAAHILDHYAHFPMEVIDTTTLTPDEVLSEVLGLCELPVAS